MDPEPGDSNPESGDIDTVPGETNPEPGDSNPESGETRHEPGDSYDCDHCEGTHTVERGKGLEVAGSTEGLDPPLYVRCPDAGFVSLSDPEATDVGDGGGDDWP